MSKQDKLMLLYDHEPNSDVLASNMSALGTASDRSAASVNYRLDGGAKRELFLNYWKTRLSRFEFSLTASEDSATTPSSLNGTAYSNHHLSNRDIGMLSHFSKLEIISN